MSLTSASVFPDLPGAEERRRVPEQHKGVPQGLHIVPRRGECAFFWPPLRLCDPVLR